MAETSPVVWVMHDGRDDDAEEVFSEGYIAIGWDDLGDLHILGSPEEIGEKLATVYGSKDRGTITKWSNQLYSFVNVMKLGDIIVYPRTQNDEIWLGTIVGDYHYAPTRRRYKSERKVEWTKKAPRTDFSALARSEFAHRPTIFRITNAAHEVLTQYGYQSERNEMEDFIAAYQGKGGTGQRIMLDVEERRAIEDYAMDRAKAYYTAQGWHVNPAGFEDIHKRQPYDLHCIKSNGEELRVEVKGTKPAGMQILLTEGEVKHARKHLNVALFIVANIQLSSTSGESNVSGGTVIVREPWRVDDGTLTSLAYTYVIPGGDQG